VTVMGEAVAVEAYFSMAGEITPRRFTWRGGTLVVEGGAPLAGRERSLLRCSGGRRTSL
jgi:hypothetical protein